MTSQRKFTIATCLLALSALPGCVSTVASVVTAPVKLAGAAVDAATTSQSEADENRGRELRKREERLGQLEREYNKQSQRCAEGNADACTRRDAAYAEIEQLRPTIPYEPR
ncbi:MAG: hypothetical protein ABWZ75_11270 [Novosphingobium sp.]